MRMVNNRSNLVFSLIPLPISVHCASTDQEATEDDNGSDQDSVPEDDREDVSEEEDGEDCDNENIDSTITTSNSEHLVDSKNLHTPPEIGQPALMSQQLGRDGIDVDYSNTGSENQSDPESVSIEASDGTNPVCQLYTT